LNMSKPTVKWEVTAKKLAKKAIKDEEKIIEFVKQQAKSKSPKARRTAKEFLETWAK
jgi:hypothetical protein